MGYFMNWGIILLLIQSVDAIRSRESISRLFHARGYPSDDLYHSSVKGHQNLLIQSLDRNHLFITQYPEDCGQPCHSAVEAILEEEGFNYEIINADHGLLHIDVSRLQLIAREIPEIILDYVPLLPQLKIDEDLLVENICFNTTTISLHVIFISRDPEDLEDLQDFVLSHSELFPPNYTLPLAEMSHTQQRQSVQTLLFPFQCSSLELALNLLSALSSIQWIEFRPQMSPSSYWANGVIQSGKPFVNILQEANLTGSGDVIGIADTGIDMNSCFFSDSSHKMQYNTLQLSHRKVIYYETYANSLDDDGHGTLVSGTSAGECLDKSNDNSNYNGMAANSKIAFFDIGLSDKTLSLPSDLYSKLFLKLYDKGAKIQSMSWGSSSNKYTTDARNADIFMWDYPDSLIFVAGGNSGDDGSGTVGTPATNKNGVAVGATLNAMESFQAYDLLGSLTGEAKEGYDESSLASFSSRGPTKDGRLKPEICGVGAYITNAGIGSPSSTSPQCSVTAERGTSFACPLLAASSLLVREYFLSGYFPSGKRNPSNGFIPSGSLIKAILIHSGDTLQQILDDDGNTVSTIRGDNNQGYGRALLSNALSFGVNGTLNGLTFFVKGAAKKDSEHYAEITSKTKPQVYKFRTVNEKDLQPIKVTLAYTDYYGASGSTAVLINDLDLTLSNSTHTFYPLVRNSQNKYDRLNNVEVIVLESPVPNSTYVVTVSAYSLSKTQPYALVITGNLGRYPYSPPETDYTLYIIAALVIMIVLVTCGLVCVCCMIRKKEKDQKKTSDGKPSKRAGARVDDTDSDDEESNTAPAKDNNKKGVSSQPKRNPGKSNHSNPDKKIHNPVKSNKVHPGH